MSDPSRCPISGHDPDCLCDVIVTEPAPILTDWMSDGWLSRPMAKRLGLGVPWTNETILELLVAQTMAHDEYVIQYKLEVLSDEERKRNKSERKTLMTPEQMKEVQRMFIEGATTTAVRIHLQSKYGLELTKTYASHLRRRTLELTNES